MEQTNIKTKTSLHTDIDLPPSWIDSNVYYQKINM